MVDGVILLVDAAEGRMPQTAVRDAPRRSALGLLPIVVINKIRSPRRASDEVVNEVFDLMIELGASDEQLDFPILYAIGRQGIVRTNLEDTTEDCRPLFDAILKRIPPPPGYADAPLQLLVSSIDLQRLRRPPRHRAHPARQAAAVRGCHPHPPRRHAQKGRITKLTAFEGLKREEIEEASDGRDRRHRRLR